MLGDKKVNRCYLKRALLALSGCFLAAALTVSAGQQERDQAKRMHDRLIGSAPSQAMLLAMETEIMNNDLVAAALLAINGNGSVTANPAFYNVVLKNWASPWTNEEQDPFVALNDYSAMVIGLIREDADFREILYGDRFFVPVIAGTESYSATDNNSYEQLEADGADLSDDDVLRQINPASTVLSIDSAGIAGIFSTRAAAKAFYKDGTNRAMLRFTLVNHLCMDLEDLKDGTRFADRIRQDVTRSPGGDSRIFLNNCLECHSGMDPMAQAFAYYDYSYPDNNPDGGNVVYSPGVVHPKYLINENNFLQGYVTTNDTWTNYWVSGSSAEKVGWLSNISSAFDPSGNNKFPSAAGAKTLGMELADTDAFAACQIRKAFQPTCLRDPLPTEFSAFFDPNNASSLLTQFKSNGNMKNVFAELAAHCANEL